MVLFERRQSGDAKLCLTEHRVVKESQVQLTGLVRELYGAGAIVTVWTAPA